MVNAGPHNLFLEKYLETYEVAEACRAAGIDFDKFESMVMNDTAWQVTWARAQRIVDDRLHASALRRAVDGTLSPKQLGSTIGYERKFDTTLTSLFLKHRVDISEKDDEASAMREMIQEMAGSVQRWAPADREETLEQVLPGDE